MGMCAAYCVCITSRHGYGSGGVGGVVMGMGGVMMVVGAIGRHDGCDICVCVCVCACVCTHE